MAYDPYREDYLRLSLRFARTLDDQTSEAAIRAFAAFGRCFARKRDSLPQTDSDRAFHLVAEATSVIDYKLPFATNDKALELIDRGHRLLEEALSLDPHSADAHRMLAASESRTFDDYYEWLSAREKEVAARCDEARSHVAVEIPNERTILANDIITRPYLRWLATMASQAIVCGRNREALRICSRALKRDPADGADIRYTAALAYAKLEDDIGLDKLISDCRSLPTLRNGTDPWTLLARTALAYKCRDFSSALAILRTIIANYPHAAAALIRQQELPDGVFARLPTPTYSEDELIIALSESTILLQEGREVDGRGPFGFWIAREAARLAPLWEKSEVVKAQQQVSEQLARLRSLDEEERTTEDKSTNKADEAKTDGAGPTTNKAGEAKSNETDHKDNTDSDDAKDGRSHSDPERPAPGSDRETPDRGSIS